MKILLLGRNGQVGWELQRSLAPLGTVIALTSRASDNPQGLCGDLRDRAGLAQTMRQVAPDVIVNAGAYTAVDKAQSEPDAAFAINAHGPQTLAQEASRLGAWLVHFSSDYVYDGNGTQPWRESAAGAPLSVYGQSKLAGDLAVAAHTQHLIVRTSWVYGARGGNFAKTMLRLAKQGTPLKVIDDQIGAPTGADLLADVCAHMLVRARAQPDLAGLYHCAAAGQTSWHGYAQFVLAQAAALGQNLQVQASAVQPIGTADYPTAAVRPLNSRLDCQKLCDSFSLHLPFWQQGVRRLLQESLENQNL